MFTPKIRFKHEEAKWSWLAGLFDGEGHVSMHVYTGQGRKFKTELDFVWNFIFDITCESEELAKTLKHFLGVGSYRIEKKKNLSESCKYRLGMQDMGQILPKIRPYLIVRRQHAEIMIEALKKYREGKRRDNPDLVPLYLQLKHLTGSTSGRKRKEPSKIKKIFATISEKYGVLK